MRVLVAGAGAIGGWLGARLSAAGVDVTLLGRPALAAAVARDGLHVTGHTTFSGPLPVITEPAGTYDVILVTCKAHATAAMARLVAPRLAPDGIMVSCQNGLGNAETLLQHTPRVVVALTSHGVTVEAPGRIRHAGTGMLRVGPAPGHDVDEATHAIEALFTRAGLAPETISDTIGHLWLKGAVNAGINPLCALHGFPNKGLLEHMDEARELVDEVVALSRAAGVRLPGDAVGALEATIAGTAENKCSMLQDVEAGRVTEIDHITGYFVRVARRLGYPLFANEDIYHRMKEAEAAYLGEDASFAATKAAAQTFTWS